MKVTALLFFALNFLIYFFQIFSLIFVIPKNYPDQCGRVGIGFAFPPAYIYSGGK